MPTITHQLARQAKLPETVVFGRHAESERNVDFWRENTRGIQDRWIRLTGRGLAQAQGSAMPLREYAGPFHSVIYSPYVRAAETAAILLTRYSPAERERMDIRSSELLIERNSGLLFTNTFAEIEEARPGFTAEYDRAGPFRAAPPQGESLSEASLRAERFIAEEFPRHAGKKLLVITHDGMIRCFRFLLEKWDEERFNKEYRQGAQRNCAFTAYAFSPHSRRLERSFCDKLFCAA